MKHRQVHRRRATVLLMVVSVLALLFVIVAGYLNVARFDRGNLVQVQRGAEIDRIVDAVEKSLVGAVRSQLVDDDGNLLGGKVGTSTSTFAMEDIPGFRGSHWLASSEPVYAWNSLQPPTARQTMQPLSSMNGWYGLRPPPGVNNNAVFPRLAYPAVTALEPEEQSRPTFLIDLVVNSNWANELSDAQVAIDPQDIFEVTRNGYFDADGDGVPDSHPLRVGELNQIANAFANAPVPLPQDWPLNFGSALGGMTASEYSRAQNWQQFFNLRRYDVAARTVSNGGKIPLMIETPPVSNNPRFAWNAGFVRNMFDWAKRYKDPTPIPGDFEDLVAAMTRQSSTIEPLLARRGGLVPEARPDLERPPIQNVVAPVPTALARFEDRFENMLFNRPTGFAPQTFDGQRYALYSGDARSGAQDAQWEDYINRSQLAAVQYNRPGNATARLNTYDRRHLLTTASYFDLLARKLDDSTPRFPWPESASEVNQIKTLYAGNEKQQYESFLSLAPGEQKFDLNDLALCWYTANGQSLFRPIWKSNAADDLRARRIVQRLVRTYYEMLGGRNDGDWDGVGSEKSPVTRWEQAFMLAANTLGFMAPRDNNGFIDIPIVVDPLSGAQYWGYTPQPYITQVVAYNDPGNPKDPDDPDYDPNEPDVARVAIAVELFNPHDSTDIRPNANDRFQLDLSQFGIMINGMTAPIWLDAAVMNKGARLPGRQFAMITTTSGGLNTALTTDSVGNRFKNPQRPFPAAELAIQVAPTAANAQLDPLVSATSDVIRVSLCKRIPQIGQGGPTGIGDKNWIVVDRFSLELGSTAGQDQVEWGAAAHRETRGDWFYNVRTDPLAGPGGALTYPLRWRVVVPDPTQQNATGVNQNPDLVLLKNGLGSAGPADLTVASGDANPFNQPLNYRSPSVPLITMNAPLFQGDTRSRAFGAVRPPSFPTPGFLMFVPRFSHRRGAPAAQGRPANEYLLYVVDPTWTGPGGTYNRGPAAAEPADLGHMPIFDNAPARSVGASADRYFGDNNVGELPWGLLVCDYFTTIDVNDPNGDNDTDDRIDPLRVPGLININTAPWYVLAGLPVLNPTDDNHVNQLASPEFWSRYSGVLVGQDSFGLVISAPQVNPAPGVWGNRARFLGTVPGGNTFAIDPRPLNQAGGVPILPAWDPSMSNGQSRPTGGFRVGALLAQSAAAYRDRMQIVPETGTINSPLGVNQANGGTIFWNAFLRNGTFMSGATVAPRRYRSSGASLAPTPLPNYGPVRGASASSPELQQTGFVTVGELVNVMGFDSSDPALYAAQVAATAYPEGFTSTGQGDFVRAVSLMALLDTHFLTTRNNTFTVYATVMDRENPAASVRTQLTVDRGNVLPRIVTDANGTPAFEDIDNDGLPDRAVATIDRTAQPAVLVSRRAPYFSGAADD